MVRRKYLSYNFFFILQFVVYYVEVVDSSCNGMIDGELFHVAGLLSCLMREQANNIHPGPKWIILDGDIDPMWIESLNTVMDDNKVSFYSYNVSLTDWHFCNYIQTFLKFCFLFCPDADFG